MTRLRTAILISGRGSNMMALAVAARAPQYPAEIACVVANRPDAKGLEFAREHGIPAKLIDHREYASRTGFETALDTYLREQKIALIAMAGFMRILSPGFIAAWQGRVINIHPSLLPAYRGLDTHARAISDGATRHGCTVHHVTAELDGGPAILQAEVPVLPDDTPEKLAARVLREEHRIYPEALARVARELQAKTST